MKNSRGISVLALIITVIVILIITSITTYTGINMISEARKKDATDKLKIICNSLRKDDNFLNSNSATAVLLTEQDYISLDLKDYYDAEYPVYLTKTTTVTAVESVVKYELNMYKGDDTSEVYATAKFDIPNVLEKNIYSASFDDKKRC